MPKPSLSAKQQAFVNEYIVDLNATQAAIRAGYSPKTANSIACQLLTKLNIQAEIQAAMNKRAEKLNITADMVLARWWQIANQNVNDLVQYQRVCCHHCHGEDFLYQWTAPEYAAACRAAEMAGNAAPDDSGGFGYNRTLEPNPDCPVCYGEGIGQIHVNDTRKLSAGALAIYRGVHQGKEGLKVLLADQDRALENVARHLGMFKDVSAIDLTTGGKPLEQSKTVTPEQLDAAVKRALDEI